MSIEVETFHFSRTYAGCLSGRPSRENMIEINKRDVRQRYPDTYPCPVPLLLIEPEPGAVLPKWFHWAHLTSMEPVKDPTEHGSQLIIMWYGDKPWEDPKDLMEKVDWKTSAEDFSF